MTWYRDDDEDVEYFLGDDLVFAVDILSPHKLVTMDGRATFFGGWASQEPFGESYGVLIAAGEPVNEFTMNILHNTGVSLPLPVNHFCREPVIHEPGLRWL